MPAATETQFGLLLSEFRERAGLDQSQLASLLNVSDLLIQKLEGGRRKPPRDLLFYYQLRRVPGFTEADIARLWIVSQSRHTEWQYTPPVEPQAIRTEVLTQTISKSRTSSPQSGRVEEAPDILTESLHEDALIRLWGSRKRANPVRTIVKPEGHPLPHGEGESQPSNQPEKPKQAPKQGDIFRRRTRYDNAYLQENLEPLSQRFHDALHNPEDSLNHAAKQGLHVFAETMAQTEGTSLSQAARENNLPLESLSGWVRRRLVPILYKDSHTTYIANETSKIVSEVYQKARETGKQTGTLLRGMHDKLFPSTASIDGEQGHQALKPPEGKNGEKQPDRLLTLKEAANLFPDEVSYSDVLRWHYSGRLEEQGRRWLARPGGRSIPLVSQAEVAYLKDHRPPVGKNITKRRKSGSRRNQ
jgi:transcriptional regulator with XRE-family HTH domain